MGPLRRPLALAGLLAVIGVYDLAAQGVTTAALYGVVQGPDSSGIGDAVVTVTNVAGGERWRTTTHADGRFAFEYLSIGGPYTVEARAIGFRPASETGVTLSLGQRRRVAFALTPAVTQLEELTVQAPDARLNGSRTGPSQTFTADQIAALPLDHNDFSRLVLLSPQAMVSRDTGISIAGQPDRLNGLQIDGASAVDLGGLHGISGFGTPGAASNVRVLPIEAIQELQVLAAPFDVRYSGFAGGLVNVITRSGSNRWEGSVSSYFQNQSLTGPDSAGNRAQDFSTMELTLTLGGPIVRDRAAFFLDLGLQRFVGERGPSIGTDTTGGADSLGFGVRRADLDRFGDILRDVYHVDPGAFGAAAPRNPGGNVLAKVTVWPALNQRIELSHNHAEGTSTRGFGAVEFASHGGSEPASFDGSRATWTVAGGRTSNELTLARVAATQQCLAGAAFPEIDVEVGDNPDVRDQSRGGERLSRSIRRPDHLGADRQPAPGYRGPSSDPRHPRGEHPSRRLPTGAGAGGPVEFLQPRCARGGIAVLLYSGLRGAGPSGGPDQRRYRAADRPLSAGPMGAPARVRPHRRTPVRRALPPSRAPAESDTVFRPRRRHAGDTQRQRTVVAQGRLQLGCRKPGDDVPARRGGPVLRTAHVPLLQ